MKGLIFGFFILTFVLSTQIEPSSNTPLSQEEILKNIEDIAFEKSKQRHLVFFFAPWCGGCKKFKESWDAIKLELQSEMRVSDYNCELNKIVCQIYGIHQYPTLKVFHQGKVEMFTGARNVQDVVDWARSVVIETPFKTENLKTYPKNDKPPMDFSEYDKDSNTVENIDPESLNEKK